MSNKLVVFNFTISKKLCSKDYSLTLSSALVDDACHLVCTEFEFRDSTDTSRTHF